MFFLLSKVTLIDTGLTYHNKPVYRPQYIPNTVAQEEENAPEANWWIFWDRTSPENIEVQTAQQLPYIQTKPTISKIERPKIKPIQRPEITLPIQKPKLEVSNQVIYE